MKIYSSTKILPYVYKCVNTNTNEFYFGSRWANKLPSTDDLGRKYFTSSKIVKNNFNDFEYEIIAEFFNSSDAWEHEQAMIQEN